MSKIKKICDVSLSIISGGWVALFPSILVDLLGVQYIEQSFGLSLLAAAAALLVATPMSGKKDRKIRVPINISGFMYIVKYYNLIK